MDPLLALHVLLCSPESVIFKAVAFFLDSKLWFRLAAVVALLVLLQLLLVVGQSEGNQEESLAISVVFAGCALTNVVAFASFRPQVVALIGRRGLHPAEEVLRRLRRLSVRRAPCYLRWMEVNDRTLIRCCDLGIGCGVLLVMLVLWPQSFVQTLVPLIWLAAGWTYLSLQAVSGDFLGLQSDSNLVEVDALMALLSILARSHPRQALLVLRFFAFRKMLGCGVCKYYGSPMWQSFDALQVHYFTQPLVNRRSRWAHVWPADFHRFSVLATFLVEVILPFLIWCPWPCRISAWIGFNCLNAMINTTGNYGFIGFLNTMENLSLVDDRFYQLVLGADVDAWRLPRSTAWPFRLVVVCVLSLYVVLSLLPLARAGKGTVDLRTLRLPDVVTARLEWLEALQQPWKLVNYQGKFSGMHDFRWEPILEASTDDGQSWRQIRWRYKLNQGPRESGVVLWLHLPRLDWRVWFLPLAARRGKEPPAWYVKLLERLAECNLAICVIEKDEWVTKVMRASWSFLRVALSAVRSFRTPSIRRCGCPADWWPVRCLPKRTNAFGVFARSGNRPPWTCSLRREVAKLQAATKRLFNKLCVQYFLHHLTLSHIQRIIVKDVCSIVTMA
ncbi:unnamed protein product [Durusdinium trenchii]|uniref:Lipase maturation factor 2 n=1 Tax=Durusdinium trenchii TaxID=1381693 RepID=A0ABP0R7H6_9DINO